ncbi:hypothetical protein D3C87_878730 [compost metagenome]
MLPHLADTEEGRQGQIGGHTDSVALVGDPVIAGHAVHLVLGIAADEDVVAALPDHLVEAAATDEDVITDDVVFQQGGEVVPRRAVLGALFDPVVTLVAGGRQAGLGAVDEIVALATEDDGDILDRDDEVLAIAAEEQMAGNAAGHHAARVDHVIAGTALHAVVAAGIGEDVVAIAAQQGVVAVAALETVIATVAVEIVVAFAGNDDVVAGGAAENHMIRTGVAQVVGIRPGGVRVVADHQRGDLHAVDEDAAGGVVAAGCA